MSLLVQRRREWLALERSFDFPYRGKIYKLLDRRIVTIVVALRAHGFDTSSSCQGHLSPWKQPIPYVWFRAHLVESMAWPAPLVPSYRNGLRTRLEYALMEFYRGSGPPDEIRLHVQSPQAGLSITSGGALPRGARSRDAERDFLEASQQEMERFGAFLRERFLAGKPMMGLPETMGRSA